MRERDANTIVAKDVPLPAYKSGDRFIHGRYGHYIQFTNRNNSPCLRITNGVDEFNELGLFDPYFDNEGSVIYLDNSPENNPLDLSRRVGLEGTGFPKLTGNQIVIESDRLIFQSKKEEVFITAAKKLDITAPEVFINGHKFIHGEILNKILEEHTKEINSISTWAVALGYMPGEKPPHPALAFLRNLMKNIFNPRKKGRPWDTPKAKPPEPKKDKLTYGETRVVDRNSMEERNLQQAFEADFYELILPMSDAERRAAFDGRGWYQSGAYDAGISPPTEITSIEKLKIAFNKGVEYEIKLEKG
jgi:hypothetical protein